MTNKKWLPFLFLVFFMLGVGVYATQYLRTRAPSVPDQASAPQPLVTQTFIMLGDAGTAIPAQFEVAERIHELCLAEGDCQAAFIAGNVIYDEGVTSVADPQFVTKFEQPYEVVELPFYIALGNHDYLGCTECYLEYAQQSAKWIMPDRYYTQEFSDSIFIVLDTEVFDQEQQNWLQQQLAHETFKHKIVVGHRPLQSNERGKYRENWYGKQELTELVCNQADLYISGHAHILEEPAGIEDCSVKLLITGTAGSGPRQVIPDATSPFYASVNGFLALHITADRISYQFIDKEGNVLRTSE